MLSIWEKYQKIELIENKSRIKTYSAKIETIIKEIIPEDKKDYYRIKGRLAKIKKKKYKIIEVIEENDNFYIVMNKDVDLSSNIDDLISKDELIIQEEGKIEGHGNPVTKNEILNLFKMEKSICRIQFERIEDNKLISGHGSGFFCEIEGNFPIKYALFTNNHILNESNLQKDAIIKFKCFESNIFNSNNIVEKSIRITSNRRTFTNKNLDFTCVEIFESDGIKNYFKIEPNIISYHSNKSKIYEKMDIFILQFYDDNTITYSVGNIIQISNNEILHQASTEKGSSGSPIIKRDKNNNYLIGLHKASIKDGDKSLYNLATTFDSILDNIKENFSEINCIYKPNEQNEEIDLIHDYHLDVNKGMKDNDYPSKVYFEAQNINKKFFEENVELYIQDQKMKFNYKYKFKNSKEIKVKFKFNKKLTNMSFMFYECDSLKSIDLSSFTSNHIITMRSTFMGCSSLKSLNLSSFDSSNVNDMSHMFNGCYSLEDINFLNFNTIKVKYMNGMFRGCEKLKFLDLSSFKTDNVIDMSRMFQDCRSLEEINLSNFNTNKVKNMSIMFADCERLKYLDLSKFETNELNDMSVMFGHCKSLKSLDLSKFDTKKVLNMRCLFNKCCSLRSLNISLFDTSNVFDMEYVFDACYNLKKENVIIQNKEDNILKMIKNS